MNKIKTVLSLIAVSILLTVSLVGIPVKVGHRFRFKLDH